MPDRNFGRLLGGFLLELVFWFGLAGLFLALYVQNYSAKPTAVVPHLLLLTMPLLGLWCLRLILWRVLGVGWSGRMAVALALGAAVFVLATYYALVLVGLQSWGRVITWGLIRVYSQQTGELIASFGIRPWHVYAGLLTAFGLVVAVLLLIPERLRWTRQLAARMTAGGAVVMGLLGIAVSGVLLFQFAALPYTRAGEPVSLTFFPEEALRKLQSHSTDGTAQLDVAESEARRQYVVNPQAQRRNIVLIISDAMRADHLGPYGYGRGTTPYLDSLHASGRLVKVDEMTGACAESSCGLLATLRSKYVFQLSHRSFTLQEVLRRYGYRLHMVLGGDHTNFYGLRAEYGDVDTYYDGVQAMADGYYINDDDYITAYLDKFPDWDPSRPAMLQFHLKSTHALGKRHAPGYRYKPALSYSPLVRQEGKVDVSESELALAVNYYDDGTAQADLMIQGILERLERKGYLKDALVVITADHGEMLGEHGLFGHAKNVYRSAVHIPFLVLRYGYAPPRELDTKAIASQVDIAPTILAELDMPAPSTWSGVALQQPFQRDYIFVQQLSFVGLIDAHDPARVLKYWQDLRNGEEFVYDYRADPGELHNLRDSITAEQLDRWRQAVVPAAVAATQL